jgi:hypothetical protein
MAKFKGHKYVKVFTADVTLEYDLAAAGPGNPQVMAEVWESCFDGTPRTLNAARLAAAGENLNDQALEVWRGICLAHHGGSKADFAHKLAERISRPSTTDARQNVEFKVPPYLKNAIDHAIPRTARTVPEIEAPTDATANT